MGWFLDMFKLPQDVVREDRGNFYEEGMEAYRKGLDWWQCPHISPNSLVIAYNPWMAGWCWAKQLDQALTKFESSNRSD